MRTIARQLVITAILMVPLWLALHWQLRRFPVMRDYVETSSSFESLLQASEIAQLAGEIHLLADGDAANMVLVGSSDMQDAFHRGQVQTLFPEYRVSSTSRNRRYGGGNIRDDLEIVREAHALMPPKAGRESVFVVGLSAVSFFSRSPDETESFFNEAREKMFPRLFRTDGNSIRHVLGPRSYVWVATMMRPFYPIRRFGEIWLNEESWPLACFWLNAQPTAMPPDPGVDTCSDCAKWAPDITENWDSMYRYWSIAMRDRTMNNFAYLKSLVEYAGKNRIRLVLVLLPNPPVLQNAHREYRQFADLVREEVDLVGSSDVRVLDMFYLLGNGCFWNFSHVKVEAAPLCALELKKRWPLQEKR